MSNLGDGQNRRLGTINSCQVPIIKIPHFPNRFYLWENKRYLLWATPEKKLFFSFKCDG